MTIKTKKKKEILDITAEINAELWKIGAENGICHVFLKHTTAALMTADLDPGGTDMDYLDAFANLLPELKYRHPHEPEHMPDHILPSLLGASLSLPVEGGKLALGIWQAAALVEFDGPREREIAVRFWPSAGS